MMQANSLTADIQGKTPIFSKVLKTANFVGGVASNVIPGNKPNSNNSNYQDLDAAIQEIALHHRGKTPGSTDVVREIATFSYIITRPTPFLKDGPSTKKVSASKSQPGPFPISHVDLAEFSLNALLSRKLYNSCPYAVADGF